MKKIFLLSLSLVLGLYSNAKAEQICESGQILGTDNNCYATSGSCGTNCTFTYDSTTKKLNVVGGENSSMGPFSRYDTDSEYGYSEAPQDAPFPPWRFLDVENLELSGQITEVTSHAFEDMHSITSITLNDGLKTIADEALHGVRVDSIDIPDSVETIGSWGISWTNLTELILPEGLKNLGSYAFASTGVKGSEGDLKQLVIPSSIERLPKSIFRDSTLTELYCTKEQIEQCQAAISYSAGRDSTKLNIYEKIGDKYVIYDEEGNIIRKVSSYAKIGKIDNTPVQFYTVATAQERIDEIGGCEDVKCSLKMWFK